MQKVVGSSPITRSFHSRLPGRLRVCGCHTRLADFCVCSVCSGHRIGMPIRARMNAREKSSGESSVRASVIIPVRDKVESIAACIQSLIAAGWNDDDELIVVDNASADETTEFLAAISGDITVIRNETDRGFAGACNQGAQAATGQWLVVLSSDLVVEAGWIDSLIADATESQAQIVGSMLATADGAILHGGVAIERGVAPRMLWSGISASTQAAHDSYECQAVIASCMLIDADLFATLEGFDEQMRGGSAGIDLCLRARNQHARIRYCGGVSVTTTGSRSWTDDSIRDLTERWNGRLNADRVRAERIIELASPQLRWDVGSVETSIVVMAGADAPQLATCLRSIQEAGYEHDVELVIAAAAPTDDMLRVVHEFEDVAHVVWSPEPLAAPAARDRAFHRTAGEVVVFLDDVVSVSHGWLTPLRDAIMRNPKVGMAGTAAGGSISPSCCAVRRDAYVAAAGMQPADRGTSDLSERMRQIGMTSCVIDGSLVAIALTASTPHHVPRSGGIAISGMHRSGTSMVTRLLNLCGLSLGPAGDLLQAAPDNPKGFWESRSLVFVNDDLLAEHGGGWDLLPQMSSGWEAAAASDPRLGGRARDLLNVLAESGELWGWKDPRNSVTMPFWRALNPDLRTVVCLRNPLEVAASLQKRGHSSLQFGLHLWLGYNRNLLDNTGSEDRVVTHYDSYFRDPVAELSRVGAWVGLPVDATTVHRACATTDLSLRHARGTIAQLYEVRAPQEVIDTYVELCREAGPVYAPVLERELAEVHTLHATRRAA